MATLYAAMNSLEQYVHSSLVTMTLDAFPSKRFVKRSGKEVAERPIEQCIGTPRLYEFELENATMDATWYEGFSFSCRAWRATLKILYPRFEGWHQAALSDWSTLRNAMATNPPTSTGLQAAYVIDGPSFSTNNDTKTMTMSVSIIAHIEVTE